MAELLKLRPVDARAPRAAVKANLRCRIRTCDGRPVEGNLQIEVKHVASGVTWKNFRYRDGEHLIRGLPYGAYRIRLNGAGFKPVKLSTFIIESEHVVDIALEHEQRDQLVIAAGPLKQRTADAATGILHAGEPAGTLQYQFTTRLMLSLMADSATASALAGLSAIPAPIANWIESQVRASLHFRAGPEAADKIARGLVAARLRLFAVTCAVFRHRLVRQLCPEISDEDVRLHMCRFLATIDAPQLDGVHPILVELFEPQRSCVERFLRAVQNEFGLRPERGVAIPAGKPGADWTPEQFRCVDLAESGSSESDGAPPIAAAQFWLIADALAWALGSPSWLQ